MHQEKTKDAPEDNNVFTKHVSLIKAMVFFTVKLSEAGVKGIPQDCINELII